MPFFLKKNENKSKKRLTEPLKFAIITL